MKFRSGGVFDLLLFKQKKWGSRFFGKFLISVPLDYTGSKGKLTPSKIVFAIPYFKVQQPASPRIGQTTYVWLYQRIYFSNLANQNVHSTSKPKSHRHLQSIMKNWNPQISSSVSNKRQLRTNFSWMEKWVRTHLAIRRKIRRQEISTIWALTI